MSSSKKKWLRRALSCSIIGASVSLTAPALATTAAWTTVASPDPSINANHLYGVTALTSTSVFAVGDYYSDTLKFDQTLVEHWNGTAWSVVASPNVGTNHNVLNSVSHVGTGAAWAVGTYYNGTDDRTLIEHWNGTAWSVVASPNAGGAHNELDSVYAVSATNVWAVGTYYNSTILADQTLIEHWNGTAWSVVKSPNVGTAHNALAAVSGSGGGNIYAVGTYYDGTDDTSLVLHFNGTAWSTVSIPDVGTLHNELDGVGVIAGNTTLGKLPQAWAVGDYFNGTADRTLVEHFNGTSWSKMSTPNVGTNHNQLSAVTVLSATHIIAVGTYFNGTDDQTLAEVWNGTSWAVSPSANASTFHNELVAVAKVPSSPEVAVGTFYNGTADETLVERCAC